MGRILIIGASGGIGAALAQEYRAQGADVVGLSRSENGLDVTDEAAIEAALAPLQGPFDAVLITTGVLHGAGNLPEKSIRALTADAMLDQFAVNAMGPALVLKHVLRLVPRDRQAVIAVLTARVGSIGDNRLGGWYAYRAAKAAANQFVHSAAIEFARTHTQLACVSLHPGTVDTPFTANYSGRHPAQPAPQAARNLIAVIEGLDAAETGGFFDWKGDPVPW